jgi:hypothetical protein
VSRRRHNQQCLTCDWQDEVIVEWFEQPPCPTCGGATERLWSQPRGGHFVIGDEFVGGRTYHNLGHEPVTIQSRSELRAVLRARGLQEYVTHEGGTEGGDRSPHTTRWASVDLEAGRILAERQATTRAPLASADQDPSAPSESTVRLAKIAWEIESAKL